MNIDLKKELTLDILVEHSIVQSGQVRSRFIGNPCSSQCFHWLCRASTPLVTESRKTFSSSEAFSSLPCAGLFFALNNGGLEIGPCRHQDDQVRHRETLTLVP
jgi:hypothetical protein